MPAEEIVYVRDDETAFLNVDLDILSNAPLDSLVDALRKSVAVLYMGREKRRYAAHLELTYQPRSVEGAVRSLTRRIERLPRPARRLWNQAHAKVFNIGIQAGFEPYSREFSLSAPLMDAVARLGASITFTVYAAESKSKEAPVRSTRLR